MAKQQQSEPSAGLKGMLSRDTLLQQVVSFVEGQSEFSALVDITGRSFCGGVNPNLIECTRQVQVYFRLSGTYEALFDAQGELDLSETFQRYCEAFQSENDTITHLAPLKGLSLGTKPISCQGFQIRKFSPQELDAILKSRTRRIFFPWASINTELLSQHCLIYAVEYVPSLKPGDGVWSGLPPYGRAYPAVRKGSDPQYPAIIESALRCVALYDWDGDYHRPSESPTLLRRQLSQRCKLQGSKGAIALGSRNTPLILNARRDPDLSGRSRFPSKSPTCGNHDAHSS